MIITTWGIIETLVSEDSCSELVRKDFFYLVLSHLKFTVGPILYQNLIYIVNSGTYMIFIHFIHDMMNIRSHIKLGGSWFIDNVDQTVVQYLALL